MGHKARGSDPKNREGSQLPQEKRNFRALVPILDEEWAFLLDKLFLENKLTNK